MVHRGFTTTLLLLCLGSDLMRIREERSDCARKQRTFPKSLGETNSVWLLLFLRGTFWPSLTLTMPCLSQCEILQVEQRIMSLTVKGWLWNTDSEAAHFNVTIKEHMLQRIFLWNSTVFGTRSLTHCYSALLSVFTRSCASRNCRYLKVELWT